MSIKSSLVFSIYLLSLEFTLTQRVNSVTTRGHIHYYNSYFFKTTIQDPPI